MIQRQTLLVVAAALAATTLRPVKAADSYTTNGTTPPQPAVFRPFTLSLDDSEGVIQYKGDDWTTESNTTWTETAGSTLSFTFVGTEMTIFGTTDPASGLLLTVDRNVTEHSHLEDSILAHASVPLGFHTVQLQLVGGRVNIDRVNITTGLYTETPSFENAPVRIQSFVSESNKNDFYHLEGPWGTSSDSLLVAFPGASFWAEVPANTSFVALKCSSTSDSTYSVTLSPPAPYSLETISLHGRPSASAGNIFMTPLDPTVQYNLTFALPLNNSNVTLHSTTFYSALNSSAAVQSSTIVPQASATAEANEAGVPSTTATHKSTNVGAIVGGTVGGVAGLFLILLAAYLLHRRSVRNKAASVVVTEEESVSPYIPLPTALQSRSTSVLGLGAYLSANNSTSDVSAHVSHVDPSTASTDGKVSPLTKENDFAIERIITADPSATSHGHPH